MSNEYDAILAGEGDTYDAVLAQDADQSRMARRSALFGAVQDNPEDFAKARKLGQKVGLPAEIVRTNMQDVQRDATLNEYDEFLGQHPTLAKQFEKPDFAKLAIDDKEKLGPIEQGLRYLGNAGTNTLAGVRSLSSGLWGSAAMVSDLVDERAVTPIASLASLVTGDSQRVGSSVLRNPVSRFAWDMAKREEARAAQLRAFNQPVETMTPTERAIYSGFESLGSNLATMPWTLGTGVATEQLLSQGLSRGQVLWGLIKPMIPMGAQTTGQEYVKAKDKGLSTDTAASYALTQGATEIATEWIPVFKFLEDVGAGTPFLKMLAKQIVAENIGEQVATLAQDFTEWRFLKKDATFQDYIDARPSAALDTFLATLVGVVGQTSVVQGAGRLSDSMINSRAKARAAQAQADHLQKLLGVAKDSKLRERDPQSFATFVDEAAKATGTDIGDVYVDARTLTEVLNQSGVSIDAAAQYLPSLVEQLPAAMASGGDIRLSVGELLATLPGSAIEEQLLPHLRMAPDALSLAEADVYMQQEAKVMKAEADRVLSENKQDDAFVSASKAVHDDILQQLTQANRFRADVNESYAALVRDFYTATAARMGVTPDALYKQYPLKIGATAPGGVDTLDQAGAAQTETPEFKNWFGDSQVVDAEGKPLVVYHGTASDFTAFDPAALQAAGFHLSANPQMAGRYAVSRAMGDGKGANVMPVYVRADRVLDVPVITSAAAEEAATAGFDAVRSGDHIVVFRPEQIKSAVGNSGAFDPSKANILEQGPLARPASDIGHKREKSTGRYVGAPDWIGSSPQQLAVLRRKLRQLTTEGAVGRYWYENSSRAILDMVGGDRAEAEKLVSLIAIYSPNATVPANTSMALTAWYQYKAGLPIDAGFGEADKKAENLLRKGEAWSGIKTNSFYQNLMVEIDPSKLDDGVATMDMWIALAFDYGSKELDQGPKYRFAESEIAAVAAEMGWKPHQVQAAIWTAMKGRIDPIRGALKERELKLGIGREVMKTDPKTGKQKLVYKVLPDRRYDHFRLAHKMGMDASFDTAHVLESKYDFGDALRNRMVQMSWEATAGATTGTLPGILTASTQDKMDYLIDVAKALTPNGRDLIAEAVGLPPGTTLFGFSAWQGAVGAGAQTFVPVPSEGTGKNRAVKSAARELLNRYAALRGYVLDQEAVVWHIPVYDDAKIRHNGLDITTVRALTEAEIHELYNAIHAEFGTWGLAPGYTPTGARILNFEDGLNNKDFQARMQRVLEALPDTFGGGEIAATGYRSDGDYIANDWKEQPDGKDYLDRLEAGGPDLLARAHELRARVETVNKAWAERLAARPSDELFQSGRDGAEGRGDTEDLSARLAREGDSYARELESYLLSEPDPSQAGAPGIGNAREKAVSAVVDLHTAGTLLARDLSGDIAARQRTSLVGRKVESALDLAVLAQVYRDRRFETFRVVFTDADGSVVGQVGMTSRLPGSAQAVLGDVDTYFAELTAAAAALGATQAWMLHNHPSGIAQPSRADISLTALYDAEFTRAGIKLGGHVVIDTNEYAVIDGDTNFTVNRYDFGAEPVSVVGQASSPVAVATMAKSIEMDDNAVVILGADRQNVVKRITSINGESVGTASESRVNLLRYAIATSMPTLFAVSRNNDYLRKLSATGSFLDLIHLRDDGSYASYAETGLLPPRTSPWPEDRRARVAPATSPAFDYLRARAAEEGRTGAGAGEEQAAYGQGEQAPRGAYSPGLMSITLLQNADLSTFLHETGHHFLEVMSRLAADSKAPTSIQQDFGALLKWFGVPDLQTWQDLTLEGRRPLHEKFAESFEQYLLEGKAPSTELQPAFNRFRSWLLNVYKSLRDFMAKYKNQLTPEVRGVMDRLLASEEQINAIEAARAMVPLFRDAKEAGMSEDEWQSYQALGKEATEAALDELQARSVKDMRFGSKAKAAALVALQKQVAAQRREVEREVLEEVKLEPVYQAYRFLSKGELVEANRSALQRRLLDSFAGMPTKLSTQALKEMYGEAPAAPWRYLPAGRWGLITDTDGLHPDHVAALFGYPSGDSLVRALVAAPKMADVVDVNTTQRMLERYGDVESPEALSRAADQAVHNSVRTRFVATELRALSKSMNPRVDTGQTDVRGRRLTYNPLIRGAREMMEQVIARKKLRDIRPGEHTAAEARAAREAEAALRKGDEARAVSFKRNQLLNLYGARAAMDALGEVRRGVEYLRKFDRDGVRKGLDADYVDQIDAMLERFELRGLSLTAIDKRASLAKWITAQEDQGLDPAISDKLRDEAFRTSYKDLTLEEFRGLVDAIKNIEHLGRLKKKLLTLKDQREFEKVVSDIVASIKDNARRTVPENREETGLERFKRKVDQFFAMHRKFASLVREMDGFTDGGALWEVLVRSMNSQANQEASMRERATVALSDLFKGVLTGERMSKKMHIPEINAALSREARLSIALNWGNDDNRQRVMGGENWTEAQVGAILDTLTREDWIFVQGVWDYLNSYWPAIAEKQRRVTGVTPEKVVASPVVTKYGTFPGGYYPIKFNASRSDAASSHDAAQVAKDMMRGAYTRATTRRGHVEARASKVSGMPLSYSLSTITQHLNQVIHDLSWHEWLIDANRVMRAPAVTRAIREHHGDVVLTEMKKLLPDIASGDVAAASSWEEGVSYFRVGATIAGLGWSLTTAAMQWLGFTQSIVRIGPGWVGKGIIRFMGSPSHMVQTVADIEAKSSMMATRGKTMQRELNEIRNKIDNKNSAIEASYFYLIQKMQQVVDVPTWLGAYEKGMKEHNDEARAIALADQAVLDAQGGGQTKDLARIQRGGPLQKLWTNFYSYFSTTYNLAAERTHATHFANPLEVGRLAVDYLLLTVIPATLGGALRYVLKGDDDDEEGLVKRLLAENLHYLFGLMIGVRELSYVPEKMLDLTKGFDYTGPAGVRFMSAFDRFATQAGQVWDQGVDGLDESFWRSLNDVGGILFHYPSGQINRTVGGAAALVEGDTSNPGVLLVGP